MKKLFQRIDRLRSTGYATLNLSPDSPYYHLNNNKYKIDSIGTPDIKCRVTLLIDDSTVDFTIAEVE